MEEQPITGFHLYVLNMQGDDHYYQNEGGRRFRERTAELFPKTPWGAMGVKFFDYNHDSEQLVLDDEMFMTDQG